MSAFSGRKSGEFTIFFIPKLIWIASVRHVFKYENGVQVYRVSVYRLSRLSGSNVHLLMPWLDTWSPLAPPLTVYQDFKWNSEHGLCFLYSWSGHCSRRLRPALTFSWHIYSQYNFTRLAHRRSHPFTYNTLPSSVADIAAFMRSSRLLRFS